MAEEVSVSGSASDQPTKLSLRVERKENIDKLVRLLHQYQGGTDPGELEVRERAGEALAAQCNLAEKEGLLSQDFIDRSREFIPAPQLRSVLPTSTDQDLSEERVQFKIESILELNPVCAVEED